jgi:hypothetical protein
VHNSESSVPITDSVRITAQVHLHTVHNHAQFPTRPAACTAITVTTHQLHTVPLSSPQLHQEPKPWRQVALQGVTNIACQRVFTVLRSLFTFVPARHPEDDPTGKEYARAGSGRIKIVPHHDRGREPILYEGWSACAPC